MIYFSFNEEEIVTSEEVKSSGKAEYCQERNGKKDVLNFKGKDDHLSIDEKSLDFDGDGDYIQMDFMFHEQVRNSFTLMKSDRIPFSLFLDKRNDGYSLRAEMITQEIGEEEKHRSISSKELLKRNIWYTIKILLLQGEFYVLVNDVVMLRRIFSGTVKENEYSVLNIGSPSEAAIFSISNFSVSRDIYEEGDDALEEILAKAEQEEFMVYESFAEDCMIHNEIEGKLLSIDERYGITSYIYEKGVIIYQKGGVLFASSREVYDFYILNVVELGSPKSQINYFNAEQDKDVQLVLFEKKALFYITSNNSNSKIVVSLQAASRFLNCSIQEYDYWYPLKTGSLPIGQEQVDWIEFSNNLVIYEQGDKSYIITKDFHEAYQNNAESSKWGLPIEDYRVFVDSNGEILNYLLLVSNGKLYKADKLDTFFTDKDLGKAISKTEYVSQNNKKIKYVNFENGVAVKQPNMDQVFVHTDLLFRFDSVTCGSIDDFSDSNPELIIQVSFYRDKLTLCSKVKHGKHSNTSGSNHYVFKKSDSDRQFVISKLQGKTTFKFFVKMYDYDLCSENDYLGEFEYKFDISNGWGVDYIDTQTEDDQGMHRSYITNKGNDLHKNDKNTYIDYYIADNYNFDELKTNVRKNLAFPFENFGGTPSHYTFDDFCRVFERNLFAHLCPFIEYTLLDAIFYTVCLNALEGYKCFGFVTAELNAIHERGFILPLDKYKETTLVKDKISDYYTFQFGWDYIMYQWRIMNQDIYLKPNKALKNIKKIIDKDQYCMVIVKDKKLNGHAMLGYKYNSNEVYVADCNYPYQYDSEEKDIDCSYVTYKDSEVQIYYNDQKKYKDKNYKYCFGVPYSELSKQPRVPNVVDIVVGSLYNMVAGWVDGAIDDVKDGEDHIVYDSQSGQIDCTDCILFGGLDGKESTTGFIMRNGDMRISLSPLEGKDEIHLVSSGRGIKVEMRVKADKNEKVHCMIRNQNDVHKMEIEMSKNGTPQEAEIIISRMSGNVEKKCKQKILINKNQTKISAKSFGLRLEKIVRDEKGNILEPKIRIKSQKKLDKNHATKKYEYSKNPYAGAIIGNGSFTVKQISNIYGLSKDSVRRYCRENKIVGAVKSGRKWEIPTNGLLMKKNMK